jgi:hypothetical protein
MGIVVKRVEYIVNIPSDTMTDNSENNDKTSFITKVQVAGKEELCVIFDSDKMLLDVFDKIDAQSVAYTKQFKPIERFRKVEFERNWNLNSKLENDPTRSVSSGSTERGRYRLLRQCHPCQSLLAL